ncbi:MAG: hypothetical protein QXX12_05460 [Nanopusillaceae archaeon]
MYRIKITEYLVVVYKRNGPRGGGSVTITCKKCGTHAQFNKKKLKFILFFIRDHLHTEYSR